MRYGIEAVLLWVMGCVNRVVFWVSGGRVIPYRFGGGDALLLMVVGSDGVPGEPMMVSYLSDGDDYVVMATAAEASGLAALQTTAVGIAELTPDQRVGVSICALTNDAERAALRDRLLGRVSLNERHEIMRQGEFPAARLTPDRKPPPDASAAVAFSGIWDADAQTEPQRPQRGQASAWGPKMSLIVHKMPG